MVQIAGGIIIAYLVIMYWSIALLLIMSVIVLYGFIKLLELISIPPKENRELEHEYLNAKRRGIIKDYVLDRNGKKIYFTYQYPQGGVDRIE